MYEINKEIETKFFKDLFNEILKEVNKSLSLKSEGKEELKKIKLVGSPKEIIKSFFDIINSYLKEGKIIKSAKVIKVKKLWQDEIKEENNYSVSFELIIVNSNEKINKEIKFIDSEKNRKYKVYFTIK
jgi:protoporphyrinogen oxidase